VDESLIVECTNDRALDSAMIARLFYEKKPDGIFAAVEQYAITSYEVCQQMQLSIPTDVKVISFSNLQTASLLNPSLSTITQPAFAIGREAALMLLKALEKKSFQLKDENIVFQSALTQRASTASIVVE
jgi:LacI family transcriptional regulator